MPAYHDAEEMKWDSFSFFVFLCLFQLIRKVEKSVVLISSSLFELYV